MDEKITIKVKGLEPEAPVTLDCFLFYYGHMHLAYGHFYAGSDGTLVPSRQVSHGGTYMGTRDMGLFTSMQPLPSVADGGRILLSGKINK